ncbi:hypothetical protein CVT24_007807 [Panaeolus cyanescens]|uniref:Cytochrome P450 n=1 Tax=Panaeolus cyanescens TaxID=181874 RepID=A0A409W4Q2_9AGAR|nr:hypothetical protein CVT24_007807 [Panaeolus cyanescens]
MSSTALELIAQSGFGCSFDDLIQDHNEYESSHALRLPGPTGFRLIFFRVYWLTLLMKIGPPAFRRMLVIDQLNEGEDFLSILSEFITLFSKTFTFAGMGTTSSALSRALWILAQRKDVQDTLRQEIREARAKAEGDSSYDTLVSCRETMRMFTPLSTMDTVLPLSEPITGVDGRKIHEIHVPKGTSLVIGLLASNRSNDLCGPDTHEWKPQRWLKLLPEALLTVHLPGIHANFLFTYPFSSAHLEVVLSLLIEEIESAPSKDISWHMKGVDTPLLAKGDCTCPQLPLMVKLASS